MKNKLKALLNDSVWSIAGLVLMNVAAQFLVYPFWNKTFGSEKYGEIIYLLSLMNIVSNTLGGACNYARITLSAKGNTRNADYLTLLKASTAVTALFSAVVCILNPDSLSAADSVCYILLSCLTLWRIYSDIEYRLNLNYKGYFLYYFVIGTGYTAGMLLMYVFRIWALALIPGELLGILLVRIKGSVLKKDGEISREKLSEPMKLFLLLSGSYFINYLIFNSDRILIKHTIGSAAVSIFYLSSLLGKTMSLITTPFNGVISGYLARFKGELRVRLMNGVAVISILAAVAAAGVCTVGSYIIIPILYPDDFAAAKDGFFICNLAQTFYFVSNIVSVVILRFSKSKFQVYMNAVYAAAFIAVCVPLSIAYQLDGFYAGLLITSLARFLFGIGVGYYTAFSSRKNTIEGE